jgi:hypothetical protein
MRLRGAFRFAIIAWLGSGAPVGSAPNGAAPLVAGSPTELAGIPLDANHYDAARRCQEAGLQVDQVNQYTYCRRLKGVKQLVPAAAVEQCKASNQPIDVPMLDTPLSPDELCEPMLVVRSLDRGALYTLLIPVPAGVDLEATRQAYETYYRALWGGKQDWEQSGNYERSEVRGNVRATRDIGELVPNLSPERVGLAGYVIVELTTRHEEDPYPHMPCQTTGCGCNKRTACPA